MSFGAGITASNITATNPFPGTVDLQAPGTGLLVINGDLGAVHFADGSTTTLAALLTQSATYYSSVSATLPGGYTTLQLTGSADVSGTGNNLSDVIIANSGNDTLVAGSGLSTLVGGTGNDTFVVNSGGDVISKAANSGNNTEQTTASVTLADNVQNLVAAGTGALNLVGNALANVITSNSGADTLIAGSGVATLIGGAGNNVYIVNSAADVIVEAANGGTDEELAAASVTIAANVESLYEYAAGHLVMTGGSQADTIGGYGDNDTLVAGTGIATLLGLGKNDTFVINDPSDFVDPTGGGINTVVTPLSYAAPATISAFNATRFVITGIETLTVTCKACHEEFPSPIAMDSTTYMRFMGLPAS